MHVSIVAGEEFGIDGARFLRAVTLGYDIGTRVVLAMGGAEFSYQSSFATHSIAGTFGAAAAASSIAGLDARQMRWALDYTAQQSSGIVAWRRDTDHIEKAFVFGGMPARSGAVLSQRDALKSFERAGDLLELFDVVEAGLGTAVALLEDWFAELPDAADFGRGR